MRLFLTAAALLVVAFLVHVVLWRVALPRRQIQSLLAIFILVPTAAVAGSAAGVLPLFAGLTNPQAVALALLYTSCALFYTCNYSAIEMSSPTLTIVSVIASCGEIGCSEQQIADRLKTDDDATTRFDAMVAGRAVAIEGDRCVLTRSGRFFATLFELAGATFRLPIGG